MENLAILTGSTLRSRCKSVQQDERAIKEVSMQKLGWLWWIGIGLLLISCQRQKVDQFGGFYDASVGLYRYQDVGRKVNTSGLRTPRTGEFQRRAFTALFVVDNIIWLKVEDRDLYTLLSQKIKLDFKNEKEGQIALWLEGISTRSFVFRSLASKRNFLAQVSRAVNKVVKGEEIIFEFELAPNGLGLRGLAYLPGSEGKKIEESLNYWMIAEGLSPYILPEKPRKPEKAFLSAAAKGKSQKKGYWGQ